MAKITDTKTVETTKVIDRDFCLEQAALCLLGRSHVPLPQVVFPTGNGNSASYNPNMGGSPHPTMLPEGFVMPGAIDGAEAWRELAAEFPAK